MDLELLKKYWAGKCSEEEMVKVEGFFRENPAETNHLLYDKWDRAPKTISEKDTHTIRETVFTAVKKDTVKTGKTRYFSFSGTKRIVMMAASLLLFMAMGSVVYLQYQNRTEQWTRIQNTKHSVREIKLEDGSKIWLKPGSSIAYPNKFGKEERNVKLQGEAYFDIAKDSLKPFKVRTDNITTRVLGTKFNIEAYTFEENIQIVLTEGAVEVALTEKDKERKIARMTPGELLNFNKININASIDSIGNSDETLYKGNKLIFHQTTIQEALTRISTVYNVPIDMSALSPVDLEKHVSGVFHNTSPVDAIQNILFIHRMGLEQGEGKLWVKKN